jgi:hypothetical protein
MKLHVIIELRCYSDQEYSCNFGPINKVLSYYQVNKHCFEQEEESNDVSLKDMKLISFIQVV